MPWDEKRDEFYPTYEQESAWESSIVEQFEEDYAGEAETLTCKYAELSPSGDDPASPEFLALLKEMREFWESAQDDYPSNIDWYDQPRWWSRFCLDLEESGDIEVDGKTWEG